MKTLLADANIVNVFTEQIEKKNVLIEDDRIIGVGDYNKSDADLVLDYSGKYVCPSFIDGHIHIESTMLLPYQLANVAVKHGTGAIIADPHEIANVCGKDGIRFMLESSRGIPMDVFIMLPSCVPATGFDESGAVLDAGDLRDFYSEPRVLGLAEMMNYPGVIAEDDEIFRKISDALSSGKLVDGHAPLLSGKALDKYVRSGITSDHECSNIEEAIEKIGKGQYVMIREGTAARNLKPLLKLFDSPYCQRCLLVTDDRHPADLIRHGHIDNIVRKAIRDGKNPVRCIRMATIQAAQYFGLKFTGAVAPGYIANLVVLSDLEKILVQDVFHHGKKVVENGNMLPVPKPSVPKALADAVKSTVHIKMIKQEQFAVEPKSEKCHVIKLIPFDLLTEDMVADMNWQNGGYDLDRDILKLAVVERHHDTGHIGLGFINGVGLKKGAIASTVSHDSHNLIIIGTNDEDMALAANTIRDIGGGSVFVADGMVLAQMPLPVAGLMSELSADEVAEQNKKLRDMIHSCGVPENVEPFMNMAFVSLTVIPFIKMSTHGLVDVNSQKLIDLYVK